MLENKVQLEENELEEITGGVIEHTWSNATGSGELWIVAKFDKTKYAYDNYGVVDYITRKQREGYSDPEIVQLLLEKGLITKIQ
ncbi:MAG: hypothetical protein Q4C49_11160 [Bacillota bacterium]|nr:hypothetical protein [Bacillota bacterium]